MVAAHRRAGRPLVRSEAQLERVGDLALGAAAEHHAHRAAKPRLAARGHRREARGGRDIHLVALLGPRGLLGRAGYRGERGRSEEHTSELQSLMRTSYAVFCLKKKKR